MRPREESDFSFPRGGPGKLKISRGYFVGEGGIEPSISASLTLNCLSETAELNCVARPCQASELLVPLVRSLGPRLPITCLSECWELNPVSLRPERSVIPIHYTPAPAIGGQTPAVRPPCRRQVLLLNYSPEF